MTVNPLRYRANALVLERQFKQRVRALDALSDPGADAAAPVCFIGGCGRSGTTVLGNVLGLHPAITYLMEPHERWIQVDPVTDIWGYTGAPRAKNLLLEHADEQVCRQFRKQFLGEAPADGQLLEKSPENMFRLPWLRQLYPAAKFIVIERHPHAVIRSIVEAASFTVPYGWHDMNNWYGRRACKKQLLLTTADELGVDASVSRRCASPEDWAALEWILSRRAFERARPDLPGNLLRVVQYETLLKDPEGTYRSFLDYLDVPLDAEAIKQACATLRPPGPPPPVPDLSPPIESLLSGY